MENPPPPDNQASDQSNDLDAAPGKFQDPWLLRPHRINNLLQVINTGHDLIEKGLNTNDTELARQGWGSIHRVRLRLIQLLESLILLARPLELDRQPCGAFDVIADVVRQMSEQIFKQEINFPLTPDDAPGQLYIDLPTFRIALVGMLGMAMDTPDQFEAIKKVSVTQSSESSCVIISYHGYSVRPDQNERLTRPESPLEISQDALWGLEYILATKIIGAHGGQLVCSSNTSERPHDQEISITIPGLPLLGKKTAN